MKRRSLVVVFGLLLALLISSHPLIIYIVVAVGLLSLFPLRSLQKTHDWFSVFTALVVTYFYSGWAATVAGVGLERNLPLSIFFIVASLVVSVGLIQAMNRYLKLEGSFSHFVFLFPSLMTLWGIEMMKTPSLAKQFLVIFLCLQLRYVWHFMAAHRLKTDTGHFLTSGYFIPFWNSTPFWLDQQAPGSEEERLDHVRSGVKLLLYGLAIRVGVVFFERIPASSPFWRMVFSYRASRVGHPFSMADWTQTLALLSGLPKVQIFASLLVAFAYYTFQVILIFALIVGLGRLCGFRVLRYVYKPYLSRSFYEVLTRFNHHYVNMLWLLIIRPLISAFGFVRSLYFKYTLAVFFGIFLGGFFFHYLRIPGALIQYGVYPYFLRYAGYWIYFGLIAGLAAFSYLLALLKADESSDTTRGSGWTFLLKNAGYFVLYALVFSTMATDFEFVSSWDRLGIWRLLFGL